MKSWILSISLASVLILGGCSGNVANTSNQQKGTPKTTVKTTVNNQFIAQNGNFKPSPIVLYSIQYPPGKPIKELLDYAEGNVNSSPLVSYQEWYSSGGHLAWRTDPYLVVQISTNNLVPENISSRQNMFDNWSESGNMSKNKDGVVIKLISPSNGSLHNSSHATNLTYEMIVPHLGSYDITVQQPQGAAFFIITKIVFNSSS